MAGILGISLLISVLLIDPGFSGPDATSYGKFARDGQDWSYWTTPEAFERNFFPMGYPTILAVAMKVAGGSTWLYQGASIVMALSVVCFAWVLTSHISRAVRVTTMAVVAVSPSLLWMGQNNG